LFLFTENRLRLVNYSPVKLFFIFFQQKKIAKSVTSFTPGALLVLYTSAHNHDNEASNLKATLLAQACQYQPGMGSIL